MLNVWLSPISWVRIDITEDSLYSLSSTTKNQLNELREPLVIRGYFSERSHPLLTPLVPKIKDLLSEYEMVSGGKVRVEFIDPQKNRELEEEAASKYSIRPVPFQTATRHQAAVVNSYFDIVVAYGDQFETLGYADLIEAKASVSESGVDVRLKNPEYAVTRAIKKVVGAYRVGGTPLEVIKDRVELKLYVSPTEELPEALLPVRNDLISIVNELKKIAPKKFSFQFQDPNQDAELIEMLETKFNVKAQVGNLLDPQPFWFSVFIESGENIQQVQFVESLQKPALKKAIDAALIRLAPGFLRTLAVVTPDGSTQSFIRLKQVLSENLKVSETDLKDGRVPEDSDMLLLLAPNKINDLQLKAVDQFLMKGGSVVIATSPFNVQIGQSIKAVSHTSGLESWLENLGYEIETEMVLDPQSTSLPVPVQRYIGGIPIREIQLVPYPHFPDIREKGIASDHPITSSLSQLTLNWTSPIIVDNEIVKKDSYTSLLKSSNSSWTSEELEVIPDLETYPDTGFSIEGERAPELLAIAAVGPFDSYFKDVVESEDQASLNLIKSSPASSRLVLISSNSFAADGAIDIASHSLGTLYTKPLEFIQNAVEWSIEDQGLSSLRGRSQFARTLLPMSETEQQKWEIANYILALVGLFTVWFWRRSTIKRDQIRYQKILNKI
jgi:ABC-2 type transport system permease protein